VHPSGVFAIDSKYTDTEVDLGTGKPRDLFTRWESSALEGARKIDLFLNKMHRMYVTVTPVVVVWGSALEGEMRDGEVLIVRGVKLLEALRGSMSLPTIDPMKQARIVDSLKTFNERRDIYDRGA
jgi:hypothetical protein